MCSRIQGARVLDVGSSQGTLSIILARSGIDVVGIDVEKEAVAFAKRLAEEEPDEVRERLEFARTDVFDYEGQGHFDTVVLGQIIEHVAKPGAMLDKAVQLLRPGGHCIITTPLGYFPHIDHVHSFFLTGFLELVKPRFELCELRIFGRRICFVGKRHGNDPQRQEVSLQEWRLLTRQEEREFHRMQVSFQEATRNWAEQRAQKEGEIESLRQKTEALRKELGSAEDRILATSEALERTRCKALVARAQARSWKEHYADVMRLVEGVKALTERSRRRQDLSETERSRTQKDAGDCQEAAQEREQSKQPENRNEHSEHENRNEYAKNEANWYAARLDEYGRRLDHLHRETERRTQKLLDCERRRTALEHQLRVMRESDRWQMGTYIAKAATPSWDTLLLPARLLSLAWKRIRGLFRESSVPEVSMPTVGLWNRTSPVSRVAVVLDEFSLLCFRPEFESVEFRPDNWQQTLEEQECDLLFVESAWRGNGGSWQYRIASYARNMGEEVAALVNYCKQRRIPTVFWNKEDPVHFDRFISNAQLFDFIFTSDNRCLERYRSKVDHDRIFALPFAAQPRLHNPIDDESREDSVCFAGTYYASRHDQRRQDMEYILKPALDFGLHIYDRQHGHTGKDADQFRFPEIYRQAIQGRLEYDEMVKAYRRYRVFLNVNSVKDSATMFSRRVFELLASGTPVISTYSKGIEKLLGGETVFFTESETTTRSHLERLLSDERYWWQASLRGLRRVLGAHTYRDRFNEICTRMGLPTKGDRRRKLQVLAICPKSSDAPWLAATLRRQTHQEFALAVLTNDAGGVGSHLDRVLPSRSFRLFPLKGDGILQCAKSFARLSHCYVVILKAENRYGRCYLEDYLHSSIYFDGNLLGRHSFFTSGRGEQLKLQNDGFSFRLVSSVASATACIASESVDETLLSRIVNNHWFRQKSQDVLSLHPYGFCEGPPPTGRPEEPGNWDL